MDLFFYRDPEEAKEQEETEAPVAPEFGAVPEYSVMVPTDNWTTEQWTPDIAATTAIPAAAGTDWTANQGRNRSIFKVFISNFTTTIIVLSWPLINLHCVCILHKRKSLIELCVSATK